MKKRLGIIALGFMLLVVTGCTTKVSYTYNVETGDEIKVTLNTTDGYKMKYSKEDKEFEFKKDKEVIATGYFGFMNEFEYVEEYLNQDNTSLVSKVKKDNRDDVSTICYIYADTNFCKSKIKDTNTIFVIYNDDNYDSLVKLMSELTFAEK